MKPFLNQITENEKRLTTLVAQGQQIQQHLTISPNGSRRIWGVGIMDKVALTDYQSALVPGTEINNRIERFQRHLQSMDLDGAFLLQNVDVYYFSGTVQRSVLFIPPEGRALLMVLRSYPRARFESPLTEVLQIRKQEEIFSLLSDFGYQSLNHVGLELDVLPAVQYLWFQQRIPGTVLADIGKDIRRLRMIKSAYEVTQIRRATAIVGCGYREIRGIIREGMTELEIDGCLFAIARREGHMGVMRMRGWNQEMCHAHALSGESGVAVTYSDTAAGGWGNTPAFAQGAGFRRVRRNEPIYIDYGAAVNGYLADQTRTFVMGKLSDVLNRAFECSREIIETIEAKIRPGTESRDIFLEAEAIARKCGFEANFMGYGPERVRFIGHGIGLEIDEFPIFTPGFSEPMQEGMVFALEPKFIFPGEGIVGLEDDYVVTASGVERLTHTDQQLVIIE